MKWPWSKTVYYKLIQCATCEGTGKKTLPTSLKVESLTKDFLFLAQGICLACRGSGRLSVKEKEER